MTRPRTWTITMPAGLELLTLNDRLHWSVRYRRSQALREAAIWLARKEHIPHLGKVSITAVYEPPDKRRRDPDNIAPSAKVLIDACVAEKILTDDSSKYVTSVRCEIGKTHPRGRLLLHITEVTAPETSAEIYARYTRTCDKAFYALVAKDITEAEFCELVAAAQAVRNASLALLEQKASAS